MKTLRRSMVAVALSAGAMGAMPVQAGGLGSQSEEWWQWALSIPGTFNPIVDESGANCMIGQKGLVWFLAGTFGGTGKRECTLPEGKILFFPIINQSGFNSPGECGQAPSEVLTVKAIRKFAADRIDRVTDVVVTLDGHSVKPKRVVSDVFEITMPPANVYEFFGIPCSSKVYSPAADDGWYATVGPLPPGDHTLRFRAAIPPKGEDPGATQDMTYTLHVVKTADK